MLANLLLDDLDKELERRGHSFCRYADDCNIYVQTMAAGERVMASVTQFLERKLRLRVNRAKSAVAWVGERVFLGYRILAGSGKGWWRTASSPPAHEALSTAWFKELGLVSLTERYTVLHP